MNKTLKTDISRLDPKTDRVIDGFRWALLGQNVQIYWPGFLLSIGLTFLVFLYGLRYFRMTERTFADVI